MILLLFSIGFKRLISIPVYPRNRRWRYKLGGNPTSNDVLYRDLVMCYDFMAGNKLIYLINKPRGFTFEKSIKGAQNAFVKIMTESRNNGSSKEMSTGLGRRLSNSFGSLFTPSLTNSSLGSSWEENGMKQFARKRSSTVSESPTAKFALQNKMLDLKGARPASPMGDMILGGNFLDY